MYSVSERSHHIFSSSTGLIFFMIITSFDVPFHHGMARPQVADRGSGFLIGRVTANVLNNQQHTASKELVLQPGVGRRANNS
jgi:hypothetical protein